MEIYEVLKRDHEEIKEFLNELVALDDDDEYRFVLIQEISNALIPHSRAEESVFYNTLRAVNADKGVVFHGYQEHMEAESLLRTLQVMDKVNMEWKPIANKLKDALEHHVEEEESDIFAEAYSAFSQAEAEVMAEAFEKLKAEVEKEGPIQTTVDMVVNMMPPRIADKIRSFTDKGLNS